MATNETDLNVYIDRKVQSGEFASAEELAAEAIRVYRSLELNYDDLRRQVQHRIQRADAGDLVLMDMEAVKSKLRAALDDDGTPK